jgi:hypothetical protein
MDFELKDFLEALGPSASLIFAAWIFLSFLQSRYTAAYERYRALISEYREGVEDDKRRHSIRDQILLYKQRVEQMRKATNIGVIAAILLIATLVTAGLNVMLGELPLFKYMSSLCALTGLVLVAIAAAYVIRENTLIQNALEQEPADLGDIDKRLHHGA